MCLVHHPEVGLLVGPAVKVQVCKLPRLPVLFPQQHAASEIGDVARRATFHLHDSHAERTAVRIVEIGHAGAYSVAISIGLVIVTVEDAFPFHPTGSQPRQPRAVGFPLLQSLQERNTTASNGSPQPDVTFSHTRA